MPLIVDTVKLHYIGVILSSRCHATFCQVDDPSFPEKIGFTDFIMMMVFSQYPHIILLLQWGLTDAFMRSWPQWQPNSTVPHRCPPLPLGPLGYPGHALQDIGFLLDGFDRRLHLTAVSTGSFPILIIYTYVIIMCIYIYICIYIEREIHISWCVYICIYIYRAIPRITGLNVSSFDRRPLHD